MISIESPDQSSLFVPETKNYSGLDLSSAPPFAMNLTIKSLNVKSTTELLLFLAILDKYWPG